MLMVSSLYTFLASSSLPSESHLEARRQEVSDGAPAVSRR